LNCADCNEKVCYQGKDCTGMGSEIVEKYRSNQADMKISKEATFVEGKYYMQYCRLQELMEFSRLMGYRHLGLAFCIGLAEEARKLQEMLTENGFTVSSVCCKVCGILKEELGLEKIVAGRDEAMCNPIGQAEVLNREEVDLNIGVGLCVGHDVLFIRHCKAPFTPLVVKDRVLAHNPVGAIYSRYYRNKLRGGSR
jgi:uncharacterized metal-binding protein